jgi:hypothetical protein
MRLAQGAAALALLMLPLAASADEPGPYGSRARRVAGDRIVAGYRVQPLLVPDCSDTFHATLLRCAPRTYVVPQDADTLNQLNALPSRVAEPYPYLFSW